MSKPEGPTLPSLVVGAGAVQVEGITGHGASRACLALRIDGQRLAEDLLTREQIISFALQLLDLSEALVDDRAYSTSDSIKDGRGAVSTRHDDALRRFYRLQDRVPILQLAQGVLEGADDSTARTLLILLAQVKATGQLPIHAEVDLRATVPPALAIVRSDEEPNPA